MIGVIHIFRVYEEDDSCVCGDSQNHSTQLVSYLLLGVPVGNVS